ncbi:MAG: Calx-beta domain-containing protein [Candidatus Paceibacterota bacterium]
MNFSAPTYSVNEDGAAATITVTRTGSTTNSAGVHYATANGTALSGADYTATAGDLSWAIGDTAAKTFTIPITNDTTSEASETVNLTLSAATGGATIGSQATAVLTIVDVADESTLDLSAPTYSVNEDGATATIMVTRTGPANNNIGVHYAAANGSATAGADYTATAGDLTWGSGDTAAKSFTIPITNDTLTEGDEQVNLALSSPTGQAVIGNQGTAQLTIVEVADESTLSLVSSTYAVDEAGGSVTIAVSRTGPAAYAVGLHYATANGSGALAGSDYTAIAGDLAWAAGDTAVKSFTIPIIDDAVVDVDETVTVILTLPTGQAIIGNPSTAVVTIVDNDLRYFVNPGAATSVGIDGNTTYTTTPNPLTVAPAAKALLGTTAGSYTANLYTPTTSMTNGVWGTLLRAYSPVYTAATTITGATGAVFSIRGYNAADQWRFNIYSYNPAGTAGNKTLVLTSSVITPGTGQVTVNPTYTGSGAIPANQRLLLEIDYKPGGTTLTPRIYNSSATFTVSTRDESTSALAFSAPTYSVSEAGPTATISVTRSGHAAGDVGVIYGTSNGTALAGLDYTTITGALAWTAWDTGAKTFTIPITEDALVETDETVNLTLSAPSGGATLGSQSTAVLTIDDNEMVSALDAWANIYSGAAASPVAAGSLTVASGTKRLLVVAVVTEHAANASPAISAFYGGVALTQIAVTAGQRENVWMGYLFDADINSGANALLVTYSGTVSGMHVKWASYAGVSQTAPVVSANAASAGAVTVETSAAVNFARNGMTMAVSGNGNGTAVAVTATPTLTPGTLVTTSSLSSRSFVSATHTVAGNYTSGGISCTWSGGIINFWAALVAVSLQP